MVLYSVKLATHHYQQLPIVLVVGLLCRQMRLSVVSVAIISNANAAAAATVAPAIPAQVPTTVSPDPFGNIIEPPSIPSTLPPTALAVAPTPISELPTIAAVVSAQAIPTPPPEPEPEPIPVVVAEPEPEPEPIEPPLVIETESQPEPEPEPEPEPTPIPLGKTQLQQVMARLFHVQSNREIELPLSISVIHIGKPNDRIPPDIDVSGFPNSEIVSRIHADIRVEGDAFYIEDVGSSNGTYINNLPLLPGNRHRLRPGDRISLGKGDLVTFLFQFS